jgi:hypothetical protein
VRWRAKVGWQDGYRVLGSSVGVEVRGEEKRHTFMIESTNMVLTHDLIPEIGLRYHEGGHHVTDQKKIGSMYPSN